MNHLESYQTVEDDICFQEKEVESKNFSKVKLVHHSYQPS
jgi:hypothetical protein